MFSDDNNIKNLQMAELSILKTVAEICDKQNIIYYLYAGTLLGSVRHNGFIPWDDDIDICMPRNELDRLVECLPRVLPDHYTFGFRVDIDIWGTLRISDTKHIIKRPHGDKELFMPPYIDIFPLDGMPENPVRQKLHFLHCYINALLFHATQVELANRQKKRPLFYKILLELAIHVPVWKLINKQKAFERLVNTLTKYKYFDCKYVFNFYSEYRSRSIHPKTFYGENRFIQFEDLHLRVPVESETILAKEYGDDYMTPPPPNERNLKHDLEFIS